MKIPVSVTAVLILVIIGGFYLKKTYTEAKRTSEILEKLKESGVPEVKITPLDDIKEGDIVFQKSLSSQSDAIQLATHSVYTHCGLIYKIDNNYFVYEAVEPIKLTPIAEWMGRGKGGHFTVKRLKHADQILSDTALKKMKVISDKFKGKHYDPFFEWTNDRLYCSELVWKIYKEATGLEIGKTEKLSDFDLNSPTVKQKLKERYGENIPLNEIVISPAAVFNSDLLTTIQEY